MQQQFTYLVILIQDVIAYKIHQTVKVLSW